MKVKCVLFYCLEVRGFAVYSMDSFNSPSSLLPSHALMFFFMTYFYLTEDKAIDINVHEYDTKVSSRYDG